MRRQSGFTLIELILTISLGALLVSGWVVYSRAQVANGVATRDYLIAQHLARLKMAEANNIPYASLSLGTVDLSPESNFQGYALRRVVTNVSSSGSYVLRKVEILADEAGGDYSSPLVRLIAYRQSHTAFGDGL